MRRSRFAIVLLIISCIAGILLIRLFTPSREGGPTSLVTDAALSETSVPARIVGEETVQRVEVTGEVAGETGAIAGTVRWADTLAPAGGTRLIASADGVAELRTVASLQGDFAIDGLHAGVTYVLRVDAGREGPFAVQELKLSVAKDELLEGQELQVWPGGTIGGLVKRIDPAIDILGGARITEADVLDAERLVRTVEKPIPGVLARMRRLIRPEESRHKDEPIERIGKFEITATTSDDGTFTFTGVPAGEYWVEVFPPSGVLLHGNTPMRTGARVSISPRQPEHKPLVFMFRFDGLSLEGRIVDEQGQPIAGSSVSATPVNSSDGATEVHIDRAIATTTTDSDGRYRIDGLVGAGVLAAMQYALYGGIPQNQTYAVIAKAEGYAASQMVVPMITVPMRDAANIAIRTHDRQGRERESIAWESGAIPASHGRVIEVPDLRLQRHATIEGVAEDTSGQRLAEALVSPALKPWRRIEPMVPLASAVEGVMTGPNGEFRLSALPTGDYEFTIHHPQSSATERANGPLLSVKSGDVIKGLKLVIPGPADRGSIRGHVIDAVTGDPVEEFYVALRDLDPTFEEAKTSFGVRVPNGLGVGEFLFQRVSPGIGQVVVSVKGYPDHLSAVEIWPERETELKVALQPGGGIAGRVTRDGQPATHASVRLRRTEAEIDYSQPEAGTDVQGFYAIPNVEPAEYEITMTLDTGANSKRYERTVAVLRPGETIQMDFAVSTGGRIEGRLEFPAESEQGAVLVLNSRDSGPTMIGREISAWSRAIASTHLKQSGEFALDELPAGDYRLVGVAYRIAYDSRDRGYVADPIVTESRVKVTGDTTTRVDLTIR